MAVHRAMSRLPPWEFTLGEIAKEAGVTAGALVQRFGSKRELLLKLMAAWSGGTSQMFDEIRAKHTSPLAAVREWAECFAQMGESPGGMAHHLAWLQQDMADPEFRQHVEAQGRESTAILAKWFGEAVKAGELKKNADAKALARAFQALISGSLIAWGFNREGTAKKYVLRDLEVLLAPYR